MRKLHRYVALGLLLVTPAVSQVKPGDLVLGDDGSHDGIYYFTPDAGRCGTVAVNTLCGKVTSTGNTQWVENGLDNRSVLSLWNDSTDLLVGLVVCDRSGNIVASTNIGASGACKVVDCEDKVYCVTGLGVTLFDKALNAVCSWTLPPGLNPNSVDVYGGRKLIGRFDPQNTRRYIVQGMFTDPGSARRPYCGAVSIGLRPGIRVSASPCAKVVNLDVTSPALLLTACKNLPGLTQGFTGTTDANGDFAASFTLPPGLPSGLTLHFAAVVVTPTSCGGLDCSSSLSITVP